MTVNASISTNLRAKAVAANTEVLIDQHVAENGLRDIILMITGSGADVSINEVSTKDSTDTIIPLDRLVFNQHDIADGTITLDPVTNKFKIGAGKIVFVGLFISAYHDKIKPSAAATLIGVGNVNPTKAWA